VVAVTGLPGVDLDALARWLDDARPGLRQGELAGEVIAGGKSNLTYRISDGPTTWALRRPPLAHVLPTAHDMSREYRVISALEPSAVPVPSPVALCTDADVLGAPFYLMSFVPGVVLDRPEAIARVTPDLAGGACAQLVETLVKLHRIDPVQVGLGDFGRPDGFLVRQLRRWTAQWEANCTEDRPQLKALTERLSATMPGPSGPAIVHGDYRLTNVMFSHDLRTLVAVVDWEMATLGDPLTDVGLLVVYQSLAGDDGFVMPRLDPADGFLTADELVTAYGSLSGRDVSDIDWYVGFGYFKLAVIAEGIHHRYLQGKTVGDGFAHFGPAVPGLLDAALTSLTAR
jgi:aminoglycoside phosphotransferase (APT) family kinase protein